MNHRTPESPDDWDAPLSHYLSLLSAEEEAVWFARRTKLPPAQDVVYLAAVAAYGRPMTLEEVGAMFGVSRERVRQLEERATQRLGRVHRRTLEPLWEESVEREAQDSGTVFDRMTIGFPPDLREIMKAPEAKPGDVFGGYLVLSTSDGRNWRVRCLHCNRELSRYHRDVRRNQGGCIDCGRGNPEGMRKSA